MSIKKTQKQYFEEILNALATKDITHINDEHTEFLKGRIEAIDKKSSSRKTATESEADKELKAQVVEVMGVGGAYTVTSLATACGVSFQKMNSIVKNLKDNGEVKREVIKGVAMFSLA